MAPAKSTKSPAFQFYPKEFLSSSKVLRMSNTEVGVYTKLLCLTWLDSGLPTDLSQLARMVGVPHRQFVRMWAGPLGECFYERSGKFQNPRLDKERKVQAEFRAKKQAAADARWTKQNPSNAQPVHDVRNALQSASASAIRNPLPQDGRTRAPLIDQREHRNHAHCGRVCLHASLFGEFVRRRNHDGADREVRDWALDVEREWGPDGIHAKTEPGDAYDFWRAQYDLKWPAPVAAKQDARLPAWARR